jgi:hypothetical protein
MLVRHTLAKSSHLKKPALRQCQPCTACCDGWLQIRVNNLRVRPGHPCPHSTGSGCKAYDHRPDDPCRQFICGWRMGNSPLPEWMRPDNAKVIVLFDKYLWRGLPVDHAVPVGRRIPPRALLWLKQFAQSHNRILLYGEQIVENGEYTARQAVHVFGPEEFRHEAAAAGGVAALLGVNTENAEERAATA